MEIDAVLIARLAAAIEADEVRACRRDALRQKIAGAIQQVPLAAPLMFGAAVVTTSGVIDYPDNLKAKTGYYWGVRRVSLSGWSAGSVQLAKDGFEPLWQWPTPSVQVFAKGAMLLNPDSRLVVQGSGITGNVQLFGAADCFESWMLPYYLGVLEKEV